MCPIDKSFKSIFSSGMSYNSKTMNPRFILPVIIISGTILFSIYLPSAIGKRIDIESGHFFLNRLIQTFTGIAILILSIGFVYIIIKKIFKKNSARLLISMAFIFIIGSILLVSAFTPFKDNRTIMKSGSCRGYIFWKVSELIIKNPFFGTGPETLLFNLNHEDSYRYKYLGYQYIDKAHSIYLGIASDSGIPALIIFIALCTVILDALWKNRKSKYASIIFWCLIVYLIQGLSFGAFICTDIVFYFLLGTGIYYVNKKSLLKASGNKTPLQ